MPQLQKISVLILSWNGRQHLEACLPALAAQKDPGVAWEVLLLDNGSTDGSAEWVREHHPDVRLIASPVNLGFCAGTNRLVREAGGDAVAFLNNDTRAQPQWLQALAETYRSAPEDVAAVSGCLVNWDGDRLDFGRGVMTFDGHAFQLDFRRPLERAEIPAAGDELLFACGGNALVRRRSFLDAGGFDETYFAYLEDVDLGWRLWSGGERIVCAPEAVVHHRSSATSDLLGVFNRGFLFERNAFLTAYKNYSDELWPRVMPAILLTLLGRSQFLLEHNNPGGSLLALDPYDGLIANTLGKNGRNGENGAAAAGSNPEDEPDPERLIGEAFGLQPKTRWERWKSYGPREMLGRLFLKAGRLVWPGGPDPARTPFLTDDRTVAQLRVHAFLLRHLKDAAAARAAVQARRRRPDAEIFERFPAYLTPTYPGDETLFADPGFRRWLPEALPLETKALAEIMELD